MNGHDGFSQTDCVLTLIIGECVLCELINVDFSYSLPF